MKKITYLFLIVLIGSFSVSAQKGTKKRIVSKPKTQAQKPEREKFDPKRNPAADLQAAIARAQKENKRIILDVGGEWCGWCVKMDYYFLENKGLAKLRDGNFIWVKVNFSPENENNEFLAKYPQIQGYPHLFVLETDGSLLHSQNTIELEEPNIPIIATTKNIAIKKASERSYDIFKFAEFLKRWSS